MGGGVGKCGDAWSVMGMMGTAYSRISKPSLKVLTFSFGGGSHHGVPCRDVLSNKSVKAQ